MIKKLKKEQLLIGVLLAILCLVIVIPIPESGKKETHPGETVQGEKIMEEPMERQLKEILQTIAGVGKVEVFITYADQGKLIIEKDDSSSEELVQESDGSGGTRTTTTLQNENQTVYGAGDEPCIVQQLSPSVQGVLIVAEGAGNSSVKKQIQETIEALFGLDAHKISIMKMEVLR